MLIWKCIHESDEESTQEVGQRVSKYKLQISKVIFCSCVVSSTKLWPKGETVQSEMLLDSCCPVALSLWEQLEDVKTSHQRGFLV